MRPAVSSAPARSAAPPSSSSAGSGERSARAASRTAASPAAAGFDCGRSEPGAAGGGAPSTAFHAVSAGSTSVAMRPGGAQASRIASRPSADTCCAERLVFTQCDIGRATPSMSDVSGASSARWCVAWSPTTLTMPERAFFALCRLARPLARPGPRCSSVAAGRSAIRQ